MIESVQQPRDLFSAITARHSCRAFSGEPISDAAYAAMSDACAICTDASRREVQDCSLPAGEPICCGAGGREPQHIDSGLRAEHALERSPRGVRFVVARGVGDKAFKGFIASYGKISGARDVLLMIGDPSIEGADVALGYMGEKLILEATSRGVATCWVSGTFRPGALRDVASLGQGERVWAVSPLGYRSTPLRSHVQVSKIVSPSRRRLLSDLLVPGSPSPSAIDAWMLRAMEVARLAPSAMNRQPWRFRIDDGAVVVLVAKGPEFGASRRLDCGIAMAHIELAATAFGLPGEWEYLSGDQVARFRVL